MIDGPTTALASRNFAFLAEHAALLVHLAAYAERHVFDDPAAADVVCGGARDGREAWKHASRKTLKPLKEELTSGSATASQRGLQ